MTRGGSNPGCLWIVVAIGLAAWWHDSSPRSFSVVMVLMVIGFVAFLIAGATDGSGAQGGRSDPGAVEDMRAKFFSRGPDRFGTGGGPRGAANDGRAYEQYVSAVLRSKGYEVRMTPQVGDFGVDILATKAGRTIAVQVKDHKRAVGVSAVQEVFTGRIHYGADEAWVVATAGFTKEAEKLAASTGVRLKRTEQFR